jgi:hypothetical protein
LGSDSNHGFLRELGFVGCAQCAHLQSLSWVLGPDSADSTLVEILTGQKAPWFIRQRTSEEDAEQDMFFISFQMLDASRSLSLPNLLLAKRFGFRILCLDILALSPSKRVFHPVAKGQLEPREKVFPVNFRGEVVSITMILSCSVCWLFMH